MKNIVIMAENANKVGHLRKMSISGLKILSINGSLAFYSSRITLLIAKSQFC
jgi:hypothetical protein